jgi:hypothetical protein
MKSKTRRKRKCCNFLCIFFLHIFIHFFHTHLARFPIPATLANAMPGAMRNPSFFFIPFLFMFVYVCLCLFMFVSFCFFLFLFVSFCFFLFLFVSFCFFFFLFLYSFLTFKHFSKPTLPDYFADFQSLRDARNVRKRNVWRDEVQRHFRVARGTREGLVREYTVHTFPVRKYLVKSH